MRNSQAKKDENRQLILSQAGKLFREHGIDGVSVADVMRAASMTHGGFYRHFADKNELVAQTLNGVLNPDAEHVPINIGVFADAYLSMAHRSDIGTGCAFAALGPEVTRGPTAPRQVMTSAIERQIDGFAQSLPGAQASRRQVAIGSWASMIGALVLARVANDDALAEEILTDVHAWVSAGVARHAEQNDPRRQTPAGVPLSK